MLINSSKTEIVKNYLIAWQKLDASALNILSDNLIHDSSYAVYNSKESFLEACWGKHNDFDTFKFINTVEEENIVVIEYQIVSKEGESKPICEWYFFENDFIKKIKVYF